MNNYELFDQDYCYYDDDDNFIVYKCDYNLDQSNYSFIKENQYDKCQQFIAYHDIDYLSEYVTYHNQQMYSCRINNYHSFLCSYCSYYMIN